MDDNPENVPELNKPALPLAMTHRQSEVFELLRGLGLRVGLGLGGGRWGGDAAPALESIRQ